MAAPCVALDRIAPRLRSERRAKRGIVEQAGQSVGERRRIVWPDHQRRATVMQYLANLVEVGRDNRLSHRHVLE